MPVPKRKTSRSRRDMRQSTKFIRPQAIVSCAQCKEPNLPHQACPVCGYYKGKKVVSTKYERNERRNIERKAAADKAQQRKAQDHTEQHDDHE